MTQNAALVLAALVLSACALFPQEQRVPVDLAPRPEAAAPPPPIDEQLIELQARLFAQINNARQQAGVQADILVLDPELVAAAQAHSEVMARRRAFDTGGANTNLAIQTLLANPNFHGYVGENAALQYFIPSVGIDPDAFARGFVDLWMKSPSHMKNLTFPDFDRAGIGVAVNGNAIYAAGLLATDFGVSLPQ
ncbi:MAG: CAP domain-containing protein [Proteobacteria bacterium]|nr:CAP domain-containing protein [Pseudomonadota bacterium]